MSQKKQLAVLAVLVVVAGSIWYWFFFRDKTPASTSAVAVAENVPLLGVDNPELHKDQVDRTRKTEYKSNGRNIFSPIPPPPPPAQNHHSRSEYSETTRGRRRLPEFLRSP